MGVGRILVIDDNDVFRKTVRLMLVTEGYEVEEAAHGEAGLECYRQQPFDLVITDILMPEKEGLETIRELRVIDPQVRIIAMSGASSRRAASYLGLAIRFGARRVLQKPFSMDDLHTAVTEVLAT